MIIPGERKRAAMKDRIEIEVKAACYRQRQEEGEDAGKEPAEEHGGKPENRSTIGGGYRVVFANGLVCFRGKPCQISIISSCASLI